MPWQLIRAKLPTAFQPTSESSQLPDSLAQWLATGLERVLGVSTLLSCFVISSPMLIHE